MVAMERTHCALSDGSKMRPTRLQLRATMPKYYDGWGPRSGKGHTSINAAGPSGEIPIDKPSHQNSRKIRTKKRTRVLVMWTIEHGPPVIQ